MSEELRVGLALGGGGARGAAHIGVLTELEDAGVPIRVIAGTSAGSLVGALYAFGLSPDQILALAVKTTWRDLVNLSLPRVGLVNASRMETLLNDILRNCKIEDLALPFAAVACDLHTGREVALTRGNAANAIRASCSIPGIFVPVPHGDELLVDGGVVNGVPVNVAKSLGANFTIAVKLHTQVNPATNLDNIFAILAQSLEIMQRSQQMGKPDVLILPDLKDHHMSDLTKTMSAYVAGRAAAKAAMPKIKRLLAKWE
ncbi:MAG: NTE family protein [Bacillota bacterium]|nr:MAG: NTE family protein [Bacillota bacterium]MBS3950055.1 patatin-like phospholipase family protein [Peptococcaceae bacterium]